MRPATRILVAAVAPLVVVAGAAGCPAKHGTGGNFPPCAADRGARDTEEAMVLCLELGDRQLAGRADPAQLEAALDTYGSARMLGSDDPRLLERMSRAYLARAYGYPDNAEDDYRQARELGIRCLTRAPDVQGVVDASGGALSTRAINAVDVDRADCLLAAAEASAREVAALGLGGVSLDLGLIADMGKRALKFTPPLASGRAAAVYGLALALPPGPQAPALEQAEAQLRAAVSATPERLTPAVDLAVYVYGPRGDSAHWEETLRAVVSTPEHRGDPNALENRVARTRAQAALDEGAPDPAAWWRR